MSIFSLTREKLLVILLLMTLVYVQTVGIFSESPTFDEKVHIEAGYHFLKDHDFRWDPFNPPLGREIVALPLVVTNQLSYDPFLVWPRLMIVGVLVGIATILYLFTKKLFGIVAGFISLLLFLSEPNMLAHGHYSTMDVTLTFFFLVTIYFFYLFKDKFTYKRVVIFAIIFGMCQSVKISALAFCFATFFLWLGLLFWQKRKEKKKVVLELEKIILWCGIVLLTIWSTYFFTFQPPLGYRFDPNRQAIAIAKTNPYIKFLLTQPVPLGSYVSTIKQTILYNYSSLYVKDSYFLGNISHNGLPGYLYLPVIFLKTPFPLLFLFFIPLLTRKYNKPSLFILIPVLGILSTVLFTKTTIVIRYILPIFPFVIMFASQNVLLVKTKLQRYLLGGLIVLNIVSTFSVFPHFISYISEFVGGREQGYKYLVDANLDWGQSLPSFKNYQVLTKNTNIQLAYFGSVRPTDYGISYIRIKDINPADTNKITQLDSLKSNILAISATCYYFCNYYNSPQMRKYKLIGTIDGSILLFTKN